jgi:glycosyltransferase involved in cell wall biosynthesis
LGVAERVWFMGFQPNPFKFLSRATVYVSPSLAEGFDMSQVEAMACGLPVIVTDAPRFMVVENERNGLLVAPRSPEALADQILRVIKGPELAERLATAARDTAEAFTVEKVTRRYEEVLRLAVDRNAR